MISSFLVKMFGIVLVASMLTLVVIGVAASARARRTNSKINWPRVVTLALFAGFMAGVFRLTLELPYLLQNGFDIDLTDYNFVPFRQIQRLFRSLGTAHTNLNLWGNILVFAPIGFTVPLLKAYKAPFLAGALWTCATSVCIELTQLLTPRTTDIDDVILNTLGGMLGALIYLLFKKCFPNADKKIKQKIMVK